MLFQAPGTKCCARGGVTHGRWLLGGIMATDVVALKSKATVGLFILGNPMVSNTTKYKGQGTHLLWPHRTTHYVIRILVVVLNVGHHFIQQITLMSKLYFF